MQINVTFPDRVLRLMLGGLVLGLFGALPSPWRYVTLIGLLPLGTGLTGVCPMYAALGWNRLLSSGPPRTGEKVRSATER